MLQLSEIYQSQPAVQGYAFTWNYDIMMKKQIFLGKSLFFTILFFVVIIHKVSLSCVYFYALFSTLSATDSQHRRDSFC